jgi:hypothetical protein
MNWRRDDTSAFLASKGPSGLTLNGQGSWNSDPPAIIDSAKTSWIQAGYFFAPKTFEIPRIFAESKHTCRLRRRYPKVSRRSGASEQCFCPIQVRQNCEFEADPNPGRLRSRQRLAPPVPTRAPFNWRPQHRIRLRLCIDTVGCNLQRGSPSVRLHRTEFGRHTSSTHGVWLESGPPRCK